MKHWGDESETDFINVDLDIWSKRSLAPLVKAFGSKVFLLHEGWEDPLYGAHLEMSSFARGGAEGLILQFVRMIERLPQSARRQWNAAERREFNIGIKSAYKPHYYELRLKEATLAAAVRVKAAVVVTIYATGKHFSGRPGTPPFEMMPKGSTVGPLSEEAFALIERLRKK